MFRISMRAAVLYIFMSKFICKKKRKTHKLIKTTAFRGNYKTADEIHPSGLQIFWTFV